LEVHHEVNHDEHTDETETEDDRLFVVLLVLSQLDGSLFQLIDIISLIFFLISLLLVLHLFTLDKGNLLHGVVH